MAVRFEETGICEHPGHHTNGAEEKGGAAAPAVDVEEGRDGHNNVDYVLDGGGNKEVVSGEAGHSEDVGYVVHYGNLVEVGDCVRLWVDLLITFMPVSWDQIWVKTPIWVLNIIFGLKSSKKVASELLRSNSHMSLISCNSRVTKRLLGSPLPWTKVRTA